LFRDQIRRALSNNSTSVSFRAFLTNYKSAGVYPGTKIPRLIHQQWKSSEESTWSEEIKANIPSFISNNPDSYHMMWDDSSIQEFVHLFYPKNVSSMFDILPLPIHKSDLFRYMVLQTFGGVYSDIDTTCLKPVSSWVKTKQQNMVISNTTTTTTPSTSTSFNKSIGLIVGVEADTGDRKDWALWYPRQLQWCQWTIASTRSHPVLTHVVEHILQKFQSHKISDTEFDSNATKNILEFTGPGIWTDSVNHYIHQQSSHWAKFKALEGSTQIGDALLLSIISFSPGVGHMGSQEVSHEDAKVRHAFLGSWKGERNLQNPEIYKQL